MRREAFWIKCFRGVGGHWSVGRIGLSFAAMIETPKHRRTAAIVVALLLHQQRRERKVLLAHYQQGLDRCAGVSIELAGGADHDRPVLDLVAQLVVHSYSIPWKLSRNRP